jgi:multicomponent Na+:H+ antiporter subunit B
MKNKQSLIVGTTSRFLLPLLLLFSIFLLMRGHYQPGGGFVGGLVAAAGFALYSIASGVEEARRALRIHPRTLIALGLIGALLSGLLGIFWGGAFMAALWFPYPAPVIGLIGTPLLFDVGVYLVVVGVVLTIVFNLAE